MSHITSLPLKRSHFINQRSDKNFEILGSAFEEFFIKHFPSQRHIWVLSFLTSKGPLQLPNPISFVITLFLLTIKNFWKIIAPFATQRLPWEKGVEIARVVSSLLECKKMLGGNKKSSRNVDLFPSRQFFETHLIKSLEKFNITNWELKFCFHPKWNEKWKMNYDNRRVLSQKFKVL